MCLWLGLLVSAIWLYLIIGRGRFWDVRLPPPARIMPPAARVVAVVPARNEAADIGIAVTSLLEQQLDGSLTVILVDDHSDDGTAEIARAAATSIDAVDRLRVVSAPALPGGWTGKLWAVHNGIAEAERDNPDFLLLTDADIRHDPGHVATLLARMAADRLDMASEMVLLRSRNWTERRLIPAFVFFFFMLYPPRWAADPRRSLAAAAGGCILIRPRALHAIGGIAAIRDRLIDDCALAAAVKRKGGAIRLDVTTSAHSLRAYDTAQSVWAMIARSAYTQLGESPWVLAGTVLGLLLTYLAPVALAIWGQGATRLMGLGAWAAMAAVYAPTLGLYRVNRLWALSLPAVALFYAAATIGSAVDHWRGKGGAWKGRVRGGAVLQR